MMVGVRMRVTGWMSMARTHLINVRRGMPVVLLPCTVGHLGRTANSLVCGTMRYVTELLKLALRLLTRCCRVQQASKAVKLRNLGQRPRNMLAKAGESDRAIRVKMVRPCAICLTLPHYSSLPYSAQASLRYLPLFLYFLHLTDWLAGLQLENARVERRTADRGPMSSFLSRLSLFSSTMFQFYKTHIHTPCILCLPDKIYTQKGRK